MPGRNLQKHSILKATKIDALIRLLADDDPKIRSVAREHLLLDVDASRALLEENSSTAKDPEVRVAAGKLLEDIERDAFVARWRELAESEEGPGLEDGAFLIAQIECPGLDIRPYKTMLDDFARVIERRVSASRDPETVFPRLCHLLFREVGLRGNRENSHEAANSYLHQVLDRKLGLPITLSVVCMLVARRLGLLLEGVGLPGHFIVRYFTDKTNTAKSKDGGRPAYRRPNGKGERYLDPFNGGQAWSLEDCLQHVHAQGYKPLDEDLDACSDSAILIRMLSNLMISHANQDDKDAKSRVASLLQTLHSGRQSRR
jgi:regulator of sirC expression with transglutaminase-like and TPR domain